MALLNWRIGPGGLFVFSEIHVQQARLRATQLSEQKLRDEIAQQVVTARARASCHWLINSRRPGCHSPMRRKICASTKSARNFGIVLETIVAEQELTGARTELPAHCRRLQQSAVRLASRARPNQHGSQRIAGNEIALIARFAVTPSLSFLRGFKHAISHNCYSIDVCP